MFLHPTSTSLIEIIKRFKLASKDPALFLQMHSTPILIDEVQYAPELFSYIKMAIDKGAAPGSFWLTGSRPFKLMELAQESLAGRIAIIHMPTLSQHEIFGTDKSEPFSIELNKLKARATINKSANLNEIYSRNMEWFFAGTYKRKIYRQRFVLQQLRSDIY